MWIPKNKKTGLEYPPVTDAEKAELEKDRNYQQKYTFRKVADVKTPVAKSVNLTTEPPKTLHTTTTIKEPVEAKKITPKEGQE